MADTTTTEQDNKKGAHTAPSVFKASDVTRAHRRCAELQEANPAWPQARVRKVVAGELGVGTTQLRYLLRR